MNKLLPLAKTLAIKMCQLGSVCVLTAIIPAAASASPYLAVGSVPEFFKVNKTPAKLEKPKLNRDKIPDYLRIKYDHNFRHGLV
jgi:hypothetical protein